VVEATQLAVTTAIKHGDSRFSRDSRLCYG
jgi:hypothetical protein